MSWSAAAKIGSMVLLAAVLVTACSGGGASTPPGDDAGAGDATVPSGPTCTVDADCALPETTPAGCAAAKCDPLQRACRFVAKDQDGDGHPTAICASTGGAPVQTGDDCDDADATTYPGAADACDGTNHTCGQTKCTCVDGTTRACYTGPPATRNIGLCKDGVNTCSGGQWSTTCDGEVLPATKEVCDGKDYFCNNKATTQCPCTAGQSESCFTGPGTAGVGPCKAGTHTCDATGKWGSCTGQVTGYTGNADAQHPCNGTNWWCDPNGIVPGHCAQCTTQSPPRPCGSATTCNANATAACTAQGTWGACLPAPITTCEPGTSSACATCGGASVPEFSQGRHTCTSSCNFSGAACVASAGQTKTWAALDPSVDHYCGGSPGNGMWGSSGPTTCSCLFQHGPAFELPAGTYTWTVSGIQFGSTFPDNNVELIATTNTGSGGVLNGYQSFRPTGSSVSITFTVTADCGDPIYLEIVWNCSSTSRQGYFYYTTNTLTLQ